MKKTLGMFFKKNFSIVLLFLICQASVLYPMNPEDRPKIGLVLSGGGARGFAHIGTLQLLDSLQIPIDFIAGTSMGGIAGALYSVGYSGKDIEALVTRTDWEEIFSDLPPRTRLPFFQKKDNGRYQLEFDLVGVKPVPPTGLIRGQKITLLFSELTFSYQYVSDFDQLPIPFRCIAVDLITGNEVVLKKGSLARAMRATMSIPTVFSPVEWGDSLLIDGGIFNNLPVDIARKMGADFIIAVNVGTPLKGRKELHSLISVLEQSINLFGNKREQENIRLANIIITPPLEGLSAADFQPEKVQRIIERGKIAARKALPKFIKIKNRYFLNYAEKENISVPDSMKPETFIYGVSITGNTTLPFKFVQQMLGIHPNDPFHPDTLKAHLQRMRESGYFERVDCEIRPVTEEYVRLIIRVKEKQKPIIYGVSIVGNKHLPFRFIYRLLGFKPGDVFDTEILARRISDLYGLGYFETIYYEVEPVSEKYLRLIIKVKERSLRKLRVGLRYDDQYKLVGVVSLQGTNILLPGLRLESELQFAGLTRFNYEASYPSRTLDIPVYPFLHFHYKKIPINIFDLEGNKIATYQDRSTSFGFGLGLLASRLWNIEAELAEERMNIRPDIAFPDLTQFPIWKERIRKLEIIFTLDGLDNVLLPRKGLFIRAIYEGGFPRLKSQIDYRRMEVSADLYQTFLHRHTIRLFGFWGRGEKDLPVYKFLYLGGPGSFVGVQYNQLAGDQVNILRFGYRYEHRKDIFFKVIVNTAFNNRYHFQNFTIKSDWLWGYGLGVKFLSPIGPMEFIFSRGDRSTYKPGKKRNIFYFNAGYKF